jgi:2-hydroxy-3-oxopropionate reductase
MKAPVGFIGAGMMGAPMIGHLCAKGRPVVAHNRTRARLAALEGEGVTAVASPAEVARRARVIHISVTDTAAVEAVTAEAGGLLDALVPGTLVVDHSTIAAEATRRLAERVAAAGCAWVDAPVSGGSGGAVAGTLTVFAGGSEADVARATETVGAFARRITHMGPVGAGQATKAANQLIVGGTFLLLAEAADLAARDGVDAALLPEALAGGFGDSVLLQRQLPRMVAGRGETHGTAAVMLKDLDLVAAAATASGAAAPLAAAARSLWQRHCESRAADDWVTIIDTVQAMGADPSIARDGSAASATAAQGDRAWTTST